MMFRLAARSIVVLALLSTPAAADHFNIYKVYNQTAGPIWGVIVNQDIRFEVTGNSAWVQTQKFVTPSMFESSTAYYRLRVEQLEGTAICETVVTAEVVSLGDASCNRTGALESRCHLEMYNNAETGRRASTT